MNSLRESFARVICINAAATKKVPSDEVKPALLTCFSELNELDNLLDAYFSDEDSDD